MNDARRVAKNTFFLFFSEILSRICSFVLIIFIARILGDSGFGQFSFIFTFANLFVIFCEFGLNTFLIREVSSDLSRAKDYLDRILTLRIFLSFITWGLIFLVINLLNYPPLTKQAVYIMGIAVILFSYAESFLAIMRAQQQMSFVAGSLIFQRVFPYLFGLIFLLRGKGLIGLVNSYLIVSFLNLIGVYFLIRKRFSIIPKFKIDFLFFKDILKQSLPIGIAILFSTIYFRIDILMLSLMKNDAVVGWYSASYRLIESLMFIPISFVSALFPVLSFRYLNSLGDLKQDMLRAIKILSLIVLPIAIGTTILAPRFILLFYGGQFLPAAPALQILIWAEVFIFINYVLTQTLVIVKQQKFNARFSIICAFFNILLNLFLIPNFQHLGASISTVATEGILFILCLYILSKILGKISLKKLIYKPLLASLVMGCAVWFLRNFNLIIVILVAVLVYFSLLLIFKTFDEKDKQLLWKILKKEQSV